MKKLVVAAVVLLIVGVYVAQVMLQSDEDRIRAQLNYIAGEFSEKRTGNVLRGFLEDYRDETINLEKPLLRTALMSVYLRDEYKDPKTFEFLLRANFDPSSYQIQIEDDKERANVVCELEIERQRDGSWESAWRVRTDLAMKKDEHGYWKVHRSKHETVSGANPFDR